MGIYWSLVRIIFMLFRRALSYWKTVTHPCGALVSLPPMEPKSVVFLSTVANLPALTQEAIKLYDDNIQVVVAGVDTVKGSRNGVSQLWSDKYLDLEGDEYVENGHKNWKLVDSSLKLKFKDHSVELPLANSLFSTGNLVTLFHLDPKHGPLHDKILSKVNISVPDVDFSHFVVKDRWQKLFDEEMIITNCVGNLIKSINKASAAKFLETNDKLMSIKSKDTEVYVKINGAQRFQVIAGGGGWGPKADTIVISPDAKIKKGDKIEFFMLTPTDKHRPLEASGASGLEFECSLPELEYGLSEGLPQEYDSFGAGSELGFRLDGTNHRSAGEQVLVRPYL